MSKEVVLHKNNSVAAQMLASAGKPSAADEGAGKKKTTPDFGNKQKKERRSQTLSFETELWERIDNAARANRVSRSVFCAEILKQYV